ncbi:hypothetical protein PR202_ga26004 [Eleusine coracana subsp. coracana]|uniref:Uncharacterized protein n=1 Tax=Eleusine coracana subsp. coracana TaxID=191504 RepID=A0AAV5DAT7_ELECO|nr:hypothetical protein PR202_ga26004 [Eleusine coracana subsp. coracana]
MPGWEACERGVEWRSEAAGAAGGMEEEWGSGNRRAGRGRPVLADQPHRGRGVVVWSSTLPLRKWRLAADRRD